MIEITDMSLLMLSGAGGSSGGGSGSSAAPYDLSGFSIPFTVTWPTPPNTTDSITVSNISDFQTYAALGGYAITVNAGTYNGNITVGSDTDIIMSNSATLNGGVSMSGEDRIRWTGGNIYTNSNNGNRNDFDAPDVHDLLFDDVYINGRLNTDGSTSKFNRRIAMINSTVEGNNDRDFSWLFTGRGADASLTPGDSSGRNSDVIIANCRFDRPDSYGNGTIRLHFCDRCIVVDSAWNTEGYITTGFRVSENSDQLYVADSVITGRIFHSYNSGIGQWNITNAVYENVDRYGMVGTAQTFAGTWAASGYSNSGTVSGGTYYTSNPANDGDPVNLNDFTGTMTPNTQVLWSGNVADLPDVSSYGAQHS